MVLKLPDDVRELLKRRFKNKHCEWLRTINSQEEWPLEINLDIPTEQDVLRQPDGVRSWISVWKKWHSVSGAGCGTLVWTERRWRSPGVQSVPHKLIFQNPYEVVLWIGEETRWSCAVERYKSMVHRWPALIDVLPKYFNLLADYDDSDFLNLSNILIWINSNRNSNLYIRQIPVAGIDSKWVESRKSLVTELVSAINLQVSTENDMSDEKNFYKVCGIKPLPQLIRMRLLDPNLRSRFSGLSDISAPLDEIINIDIAPAYVFIVENIQTALAFKDLKNAVVIMGLGYGVDVLAQIRWLHSARCIYWGDIDTHGFAILNRARLSLPNLESILMDEQTLFSHRALWVEEKTQCTSIELPLLTGSELNVYQSLKKNIWGQQVRLEQERICWNETWKTVIMLSKSLIL